MGNRHSTKQAAAVLAFVLCCCLSFHATAQTIGAACVAPASAGSPALIQSSSTSELLICNGSTWALAEAITTGGNVGIGTTSPGTLLEVHSGDIRSFDGTTAARLSGTGTQGGPELLLGSSGNSAAYMEIGAYNNLNNIDTKGRDLQIFSGSAPVGITFANATGRVGIGSTSPVSSLDISQKTDALALPTGTTGQRPTGTNGMVRYNTTVPQLEGYINGAWAGLATSGGLSTITLGTSASVTNPQRSGDATTGLFSAATGKVSVSVSGTDVADYSSTGETILTSTSQGTGLTVNGGVWGLALTSTSDQRLKKNIQTIENALERVEKLRGVSFDWRTVEEREIDKDANLPTDQHQLGVIAQEVEQVFPEAVSTGNGGVKNVNYNMLTGPLIEAVKEQQREMRQMQGEIDDLKQQLSNVKANSSFQPQALPEDSEFPSGRNGER